MESKTTNNNKMNANNTAKNCSSKAVKAEPAKPGSTSKTGTKASSKSGGAKTTKK